MREVIITQALYGFDQKNRFFKGVVLVQVFYFKTGTWHCPEILELCKKMSKSKGKICKGKLAGNLFALPPPPILNRFKNKLADSGPAKTIKKEKYGSHYFITCGEEVTFIVTIIILENMF